MKREGHPLSYGARPTDGDLRERTRGLADERVEKAYGGFMKYLQRSLEVAEARGYFRAPEVLRLQGKVPDWLRALAHEDGLAKLEARLGLPVPGALREFYACSLLACFLEASIDGEVFLSDPCVPEGEPPQVVSWWGRPHLALAFHGHSGMVCAAGLGEEDPLVYWGFEDEEEPYVDERRPPRPFSEWVFRIVDGHEATLDYWQKFYEELTQSDPRGLLTHGLTQTIFGMPGMGARLRRR
ncbi:hypothetical protein [Hyalangium versicolor]|uniref:hypothetical protein n=1 Tax=Hyalangium versicolor TaxID=2861190 RepID=UPI001CC96795|nr:hypothetical protein [Hyalangium versicolor]